MPNPLDYLHALQAKLNAPLKDPHLDAQVHDPSLHMLGAIPLPSVQGGASSGASGASQALETLGEMSPEFTPQGGEGMLNWARQGLKAVPKAQDLIRDVREAGSWLTRGK